MAKKLRPIPTVPFEILIEGHESVNADHEHFGMAEPTISLVRALSGKHEPMVILAVSYRLAALAKLLREGEGKPWTFAIAKDKSHMVNEALFRAAARAPLLEAKTAGNVSFDTATFMQIALEESETEGKA